jgi:hypothetical protein
MLERKLYVVPGWRYKLVVALLRASPFWLQTRLARIGAARTARRAH